MSTKSLELDNEKNYLNWFRHAAPYINAHRHKTFVIMLDGHAFSSENFKEIVHDLTLLHSLGIRLVLVYDAIPQIKQHIENLNFEIKEHSEHLVITRELLSPVIQTVGAIRVQIESMFSMGLVNSPMFGSRIDVVSGNFVTAKPLGIHAGVDLHLSGEVRAIDNDLILKLLNQNNIVLVSPLGYSKTGEIFNIQATEVATKTAIAVNADKLIFLGNTSGLLNTKRELLREISSFQLDEYMRAEENNLLKDYLIHAKEAVLNGVNRVHILPFWYKGAVIQELFTRDGVGTMITDEHYEQVRVATIQDVGGLMNLLRPLEEQGILVYRSRERLETEIHQFAVIERDGAILACAALYPIPAQENEKIAAEIACVAVDPSYRKSNRGIQILNYLEEKAKKENIQQLFALTTRTSHWFIENGFIPATVDDLPSARQELYNYQRNSLVFKKELVRVK